MENKRHRNFSSPSECPVLVCQRYKEEDGTEQCTLTDTLRTYKMYVPIQLHFRIWNMGTVQKNNLIQVSHLAPPLKL